MLLLLIFVFGVWLWDNHLGQPAGHQPDAWEFAMRKADRDLRIAEGTEKLPAWLRPVLGIDTLEQTLATTEASFTQLARLRHHHNEDPATRALNDEGAYALAVIIAVRNDGNPATGPFNAHGLPGPPPPGPIMSRVISSQENWWDLAYLRGLDFPGTEEASQLVDARTQHLTNNAIKARGAVLALALSGLVFIPGTLIAFVRAGKSKRRRPVNYSHHWHIGFGLGVFLLAYLASVGFSITFNAALQQAAPEATDGVAKPLMSMPLFITLDGLTRFLPALIALGLLFRRSRHAVSRLGIAGPLDAKLILGSFAILQIIEFGLRMTLDRSGAPNPTGGLDASEAGLWGLAFGVVSACIAAPIAEEILYRGVLFRSLANRINLTSAVLISSVVFALVHFYPISSLITVFSVGVTCALCYASSRTLLTAIALHALYNAAIKLPEWIVYHAPLS
ncbi:CPBP family intramembrane glutamic endopeptidase [Haloferula sp.]|uniref:CPBP family intramembrane glutamic endopeptidase n=1 Tax=Haloferula sp. TaxID=2497595 RepID=UPI00329FA669